MRLASPAAAAQGDLLSPVGVWSCLVYGHPRFGNVRLTLAFHADGSTGLRRSSRRSAPWVPISAWIVEDDRMRFTNWRTGREFEADLHYSTLGGTWETLTAAGGWWCSSSEEALADESLDVRRASADEPLPPLVPQVTATPQYPRQAIREAREGHAVVCFLVTPDGRIVDPHFIELSDDIFRASTLEALEDSRYRASENRERTRPGCRSFIFTLDAIY